MEVQGDNLDQYLYVFATGINDVYVTKEPTDLFYISWIWMKYFGQRLAILCVFVIRNLRIISTKNTDSAAIGSTSDFYPSKARLQLTK